MRILESVVVILRYAVALYVCYNTHPVKRSYTRTVVCCVWFPEVYSMLYWRVGDLKIS